MRCIEPAGLGRLKFAVLQNFAASQFAFGTVLYLRMVDMRDNGYCLFLMGKSCIAHIRLMTVPRLELSAAALAVQLEETIPLRQSVLWMDSITVLQYIKNQSARFHMFVSNHLTAIHEHSETKPVEIHKLWAQSCLWCQERSDYWHDYPKQQIPSGPEFLTKEEHLWPWDLSYHQMELFTDYL